jgi:hypothetical protein
MLAGSSASWQAEDARELFVGPLAVEGVGADEGDVGLGNPGLAELGEKGFDRDAPDVAEGGRGGVVEGDEDAVAGLCLVAEAGDAEGVGEGVCDELLL